MLNMAGWNVAYNITGALGLNFKWTELPTVAPVFLVAALVKEAL